MYVSQVLGNLNLWTSLPLYIIYQLYYFVFTGQNPEGRVTDTRVCILLMDYCALVGCLARRHNFYCKPYYNFVSMNKLCMKLAAKLLRTMLVASTTRRQLNTYDDDDAGFLKKKLISTKRSVVEGRSNGLSN